MTYRYVPARAAIPAGDITKTQLSAARLSGPAIEAITVIASAVDDATTSVTRAVVLVAVIHRLAVVATHVRCAVARQLVGGARLVVHAERAVALGDVTEAGQRVGQVAVLAVAPEI